MQEQFIYILKGLLCHKARRALILMISMDHVIKMGRS